VTSVSLPSPFVVALVAAKDEAATIAATVIALRRIDLVDEVLVVDDGSRDGTGQLASAAGARVLRLPENVGKGAAITSGIEATPEAGVYLLVDADVGPTAAAARALLGAVLAGEADMTIGTLPAAGGRGGFGLVRDLARGGIRRATGFAPQTPLSGQRAVRADFLRKLTLAYRFGLETALTLDAARAGWRVTEVPIVMEHRHTGRGLTGFAHRARQGADIVRALWPRLTSATTRLALIALALVLALGAVLWSGTRWEPRSVAPTSKAGRVVIFGVPHLGWPDVRGGVMPNLGRLVRSGAVATMSVRTLSPHPSVTEGYATLGAATRVKADDVGGAAEQVPGDGVAVRGGPATIQVNRGKHLSTLPGALGDALHRAGLRTAVVGNADTGPLPGGRASILCPAAVALMDSHGSVDAGAVEPDQLLRADPGAPFGRRADAARVVAETRAALSVAQVVVVDPGDIDRALEFGGGAETAAAAQARQQALAATDDALGQVVGALPRDTLLLVVSVAPPGQKWHLVPTVAAGAGVVHGYLHSPSTKRLGLVTLTDVAPTVLQSLGAAVPDGMVGQALRYHAGQADLGRLANLDRDGRYRESLYFPIVLGYVVLHGLVYLVAVVALSRRRGVGRSAPVLRYGVLAIAAFPLASFVLRALPVAELASLGWALLFALDAMLVALVSRARRHPLSPLAWLLGLTGAVLLADVATGARLQVNSILGYSPLTAARFFGIGNSAFAVLAAAAILVAAIHLQYAPRRREALFAVTALLVLVVVVDGAPSLGDDAGGIATLVPVFGLALFAFTGRRVTWRRVGLLALVTLAVLGGAAGVDLLRPPDARTHLGKFVSDLVSGRSSASVTTVVRKAATNVRVLRETVWAWIVPIIAGFILYLVVWERRLSRLLPVRSALRVGLVAALAAGLLGFALNDSGVVVTALVLVFVGPYLTLLALNAERSGPELLEPTFVTEPADAAR